METTARETPWERRKRLAREEREEHRRWMRRHRYGRGQGVGGLALGVILVAAAVAFHSARSDMTRQGWRSELEANVESLRAAQLSHEASYGRFLHVGHPAEAYDAFDAGRPYAPETELGWRPDRAVGAYWAVAREHGFEVHGLLDADGDGIPAHWTATEAVRAYPLTDPDVF